MAGAGLERSASLAPLNPPARPRAAVPARQATRRRSAQRCASNLRTIEPLQALAAAGWQADGGLARRLRSRCTCPQGLVHNANYAKVARKELATGGTILRNSALCKAHRSKRRDSPPSACLAAARAGLRMSTPLAAPPISITDPLGTAKFEREDRRIDPAPRGEEIAAAEPGKAKWTKRFCFCGGGVGTGGIAGHRRADLSNGPDTTRRRAAAGGFGRRRAGLPARAGRHGAGNPRRAGYCRPGDAWLRSGAQRPPGALGRASAAALARGDRTGGGQAGERGFRWPAWPGHGAEMRRLSRELAEGLRAAQAWGNYG